MSDFNTTLAADIPERNKVEDLKKKKNNRKADVKIQAQAAKILRQETLDKRQVCSGSFTSDSESDTYSS